MIRFDVAWAYVHPRIKDTSTKSVERKYLDDKLLKLIEKWVREVKGEDYDLKNLIYEFDADSDTFQIFNYEGSLIAPLKDRVKVYGTTYMNDNMGGWGYNKAFWKRGWSKDEFVLGIGNHDPQPLRQIANDVKDIGGGSHKRSAIKVLSKLFHISEETLEQPVEFAKAKWAETMMGKNNMIFYMDAFGREERFDLQVLNTTLNPEKNYAYKVPCNYEEVYQEALKEGFIIHKGKKQHVKVIVK